MSCLLMLLTACANPALREADRLRESGQYEAALTRLQQASQAQPEDLVLKGALAKQRDSTLAYLLYQAEAARVAGQPAELDRILARAQIAAPGHPRVEALKNEIARRARQNRLLEEARVAVSQQAWVRAEAAFRAILAEDPGHQEARQQLARIDEQRTDQTRRQSSVQLAMAGKPITLEFREAALRTVFEALARAAQVNFVFDKDVRGDAKVTLFLRDTTVDEAMKVILNTQQLGYKLLNDRTVLIYPNTTQKQRDLLDTVTRSFYLVNADPKQAQNLIRTVAKTRDIFVDERLNLVVVRDTPEVVRLIERLVASIDLPDPEVMLELEVMEVSSNKVNEIGLDLVNSANYGLPGGLDPLTSFKGLRWSTTNPLAVATLRGTKDSSNLLANPKIRARNREKAKISLGEKLPVFTTTTVTGTATANTVNVTYVDVGLKLELEPQVQLDNEVIIKVALEVSNITNKVTGPEGSLAYQVGSRLATTSLRLRDGETQVLAGLISDDESRNYSGLPGLQDLPILNRLFGKNLDERKKTEVVLLITPRVIRNLNQGSLLALPMASGTEALPGAAPFTMEHGQAGGLSAPGGAAPRAMPAAGGPVLPLSITGPEEVQPGASFSITVRNAGDQTVNTSVMFDSSLIDAAGAGPGTAGRAPVSIGPHAEQSVLLTAKAGTSLADTQLTLETPGQPWPLRIRDPNLPQPAEAEQ